MSLWSGRRILVTGGAGFIGSNLVERLAELGARVRVVDNLQRGRLENLQSCIEVIEFMRGDLTQPDVCLEACRDMEMVIHLGSRVGGISYYVQRPAEVMLHNVLMDTLVWQAATVCGVERYLYASSAHVYPLELQDNPEAPFLREEQAVPANPPLSYGWAKLLGEKQLEYSAADVGSPKVTILRLIGVYGKNQNIDLETGSAIPVFIRRAIEYPRRRPFTILGSGEETRSYCYITDVVDAMLSALEKLAGCQLIGPLNVGSETRLRIRDLVREIIDISGKQIQIVSEVSHKTTIWGQALDCAKATSVLGWQPRVSLREGLERTYQHIEERLEEEKAVLR
jgi:nucleoside-diphosphate-sugar epimerase